MSDSHNSSQAVSPPNDGGNEPLFQQISLRTTDPKPEPEKSEPKEEEKPEAKSSDSSAFAPSASLSGDKGITSRPRGVASVKSGSAPTFSPFQVAGGAGDSASGPAGPKPMEPLKGPTPIPVNQSADGADASGFNSVVPAGAMPSVPKVAPTKVKLPGKKNSPSSDSQQIAPVGVSGAVPAIPTTQARKEKADGITKRSALPAISSVAAASTKPSQKAGLSSITAAIARPTSAVAEKVQADEQSPSSQLALRAIFGVEDEMTKEQIIEHACNLPGIKDISAVPSDQVAGFNTLRDTIAKLGFVERSALKLGTGSGIIDFVTLDGSTMLVHREGDYKPGVRETLMIVAGELGKLE